MFFSVIIIPFFGSLFVGMLGFFVGQEGAFIIIIFSMLISFFLAMICFYDIVLLNSNCIINLGDWINNGLLVVKWSFLYDSLSTTMIFLVVFISLLVHVYSMEYMKGDPHIIRFMSYLSLFTFFMLILVSSNNFFQLFLGWEGVGLCSFLLISFWFTRMQANKAAIKAIIVNKIGDFGLAVGIIAIYNTFLSVDFSVVFSLVLEFSQENFYFSFFQINKITFIALMLFIGAVGKSAQLGLHTWLPDAMEGPTPVSALIHAATMVTAGVFVLLRCSPIFEYSDTVLFLITIVGAVTALFGATIGMLQNDLKKVIAFSTCSQLGYMVFSCGLSAYHVAFFHLCNHAFFKALLFLSAGSVIHSLLNEQDMRRMGGLLNLLPVTYVLFLIGSLSLAGFPFLTGFYSKDLILELSISKYTIDSVFSYWLGTLSAFLTAFYSFRLIYLTFFIKTNIFKPIINTIHDVSFIMGLPLFILAIGSIFFGYILKDLFVGFGNITFSDSIYVREFTMESEFIPVYLKLLPVFFSLLGIILVLVLNIFFSKYLYLIKFNIIGRFVYFFLMKKWYFDLLINYFIIQKIFNISYFYTFKFLDRGIIEILGPKGFSFLSLNISNTVSNLQKGFLFYYIVIMILSFFLLFIFFFFQAYIYILIDLRLILLYFFLIMYLFYYNFKN